MSSSVTVEAQEGREVAVPPGAVSKRRRWVKFRRDRTLIIMTLPAAALLLVFGYTPMLGLVMAFQNYDLYDGILHSPWAGVSNFQQLFTDPGFWQAFRNTLELFSVQLILSFPVPIILAIMLDSILSRRLRAVIQSVVTLPHFFSMVMVVTIFNEVLGGAGLLDTFLRSHGVTNPPEIMTNPGLFKFLISGQIIWKESGWGMIVYLAALAAQDLDGRGIGAQLHNAQVYVPEVGQDRRIGPPVGAEQRPGVPVGAVGDVRTVRGRGRARRQVAGAGQRLTSADDGARPDGVVRRIRLHGSGGLIGEEAHGYRGRIRRDAGDDVLPGVLKPGDHLGVGHAEMIAAQAPHLGPIPLVDRREVRLDDRPGTGRRRRRRHRLRPGRGGRGR
jgi:hypothetical protein